MLDARLAEMGLNKDDYWWYRDLRRYGTVPHSGFGLGFERLVVYVTGMGSVRDVIPFPVLPRTRRVLGDRLLAQCKSRPLGRLFYACRFPLSPSFPRPRPGFDFGKAGWPWIFMHLNRKKRVVEATQILPL